MRTKKRTTIAAIGVLYVCLGVVSLGSEQSATGVQSRSFVLPQHGQLILNVPSTWKQNVRQPTGDLPPTIRLSPDQGDDFIVLITPFWNPKKDPNFNKPAVVKSLINGSLLEMLTWSVEKEVSVQEFKGLDGTGYYFLLTDKAPKPGEYPYVVRAGVGVGDLLLFVTVLCRSKESEAITGTIKALQEAQQTKSSMPSKAPIAQTREGFFRIPVPSTSIVIEFPLAGFEVEIADKSRPYYYLVNQRTGMAVSFSFELLRQCDSSQTCRDYFARERLGMQRDPNKKNWRMDQIGEVFVSEYMFGPVLGVDLRQHHMNAHYVKEGVWIDVHLSKVNFQEADRSLFVGFVGSLEFAPAE